MIPYKIFHTEYATHLLSYAIPISRLVLIIIQWIKSIAWGQILPGN